MTWHVHVHVHVMCMCVCAYAYAYAYAYTHTHTCICICIHTYAYSAGIYILRCPCISHSTYMLLPRPLAQPRRSGPRAHPCSPSRWRSARPTTGCGDTSCSRTLSRRRRTRPRAPHPTSSRSSRPRPRRGEAVGCCIVVVAETVDNLRREGLFSISSEVWAKMVALLNL